MQLRPWPGSVTEAGAMKHDDDLLLLALVAALLTLQALRPLLVALVALVLTLAGYRPSKAPVAAPAPITPPAPRRPAAGPLTALPPCRAAAGARRLIAHHSRSDP